MFSNFENIYLLLFRWQGEHKIWGLCCFPFSAKMVKIEYWKESTLRKTRLLKIPHPSKFTEYIFLMSYPSKCVNCLLFVLNITLKCVTRCLLFAKFGEFSPKIWPTKFFGQLRLSYWFPLSTFQKKFCPKKLSRWRNFA